MSVYSVNENEPNWAQLGTTGHNRQQVQRAQHESRQTQAVWQGYYGAQLCKYWLERKMHSSILPTNLSSILPPDFSSILPADL
jgi:hypothetical protein